MSEWEETMRALLGKQVIVTLSHKPFVSVSGTLHTFGDDGGVYVREEDGTYRWAWPNLYIREVAS